MVYWTSIDQPSKTAGQYSNESFRSRNGYKEMEVHNSPHRRNKDFKPVLYGDFIGMLNFKLSEPWALMRHFPDLVKEKHQKPIRWIRSVIAGGIIGFIAGVNYQFWALRNTFETRKLFIEAEKGAFNIKRITSTLSLYQRPVFMGSALFLSYNLLYDFFNHHKEALDRPDMWTHLKVWLVLSPLSTAVLLGPGKILQGLAVSMLFMFPVFYGAKNYICGDVGGKHNYYFYQNSVSQAERDKFEHQDRIENIASTMRSNYGYSYGRYKDWTTEEVQMR